MFNRFLKSIRPVNFIWLGLSGFAILIDQWTKHIASAHLIYGEPQSVLPMLDWTLLHNHGAAFSFLSDAGGWQRYLFTGLAIVVSVVFVGWLLRLPKQAAILATGIALILGGAVGNLIDRISLGYVVDFISFYYKNHYFPAFNIADSAITLGTILLVIDMLFLEKNRQNQNNQGKDQNSHEVQQDNESAQR